MNTMKFFDEVLEAAESALHPAMVEAITASQAAVDADATLNKNGEVGLCRLAEIWYCFQPKGSMLILEGSGTPMLAELLAQIYVHLMLHPQTGPVGLAMYLELQYMIEELLQGEWFD